jgi:hypothetical protein
MATTNKPQVFDDEVREEAVLEKLGYQQELKRSVRNTWRSYV